ncbi:MAG: hypothetical protein JRD84_01525 [Deltaproteobacteria bacterium]|jgi:hypothetical protein|nr:hypothetical protein [Deltaproteobacteria bacterium]
MKISRLYFVLSLSILLMANTWLMAEPPSFTTADVFNGHMWQLLSSSQKAGHLTGIQEGIKLCLNQINGDLQISAELMDAMKESGVFDRRRLLFTSQGIGAIEAGLNKFYGDSANLEIPIIDAYQHVSMELNFASARELDNNLSNIRRKYTE